MNKTRIALPGLLALCAALIVGAIAVAVTADAVIRRSVISAGGGTAAGGQASVSGLVGQAITGRSIGPSTQIRGGWWASTGSTGVSRASFIPVINRDICAAFAGTRECEDNDLPDQANGPLTFGQPLKGALADGNESSSDQNTEDWFHFYWAGAGSLTLDVTAFSPVGQVVLYYESAGAGAVAQAADEPSGNYRLAYGGSKGAGKYFVRLFVPGDQRPAGAPEYTLVVNK